MNNRLAEARQQMEALVSANSDATLAAMKRVVEQMRVERAEVSFGKIILKLIILLTIVRLL